MNRQFSITLPANTNAHNLYSLLVGTVLYGLVNGGTDETAVTGAVPTDGILPDRVQELTILFGGSITARDRNSSSGGHAYTSGDALTKRSMKNTICLKDFLLVGAAGSETLDVEISCT